MAVFSGRRHGSYVDFFDRRMGGGVVVSYDKGDEAISFCVMAQSMVVSSNSKFELKSAIYANFSSN